MIEPPEGVVQVRIGTQCERKPSFARRIGVEAGVAFGSLQECRRHGIKFQKDGGVRTESSGVREGGEDSFSTIKGAESEHALCEHTGPGEQFRFEQRRASSAMGRSLGRWRAGFLRFAFGLEFFIQAQRRTSRPLLFDGSACQGKVREISPLAGLIFLLH